MAYTKYSLTPANNTAAPPDGAPEGMLPSAVNDTMRDMMAQIRDAGDGIRDGTYTMTAAKITGGTITGVTFSSIVVTGGSITGATVTSNTFSSSGATITGGTINSTAIGGTTAAAGKFTTLEATGVTTVQAGTDALPAITTTGDTNTGIFFPAADTFAASTAGSERMRIDSSGNLLVGITSTLLASGSCFVNNTVAGDSPQLIVRNAQNTAGRYWKIGATADANPYMIVYNASNAGVYMGYGDVNWSSSSDESKKENLVPITDAVTKISSLRTVMGNFIDDEKKTKHPFLIAQDVQKVLPEAVNEKDGVLGLKYSDMIPLLVASIKELKAELDSTKAEVQALKGVA